MSLHILIFIASSGRGGAESLVVNLCNQLVKKNRVSVLHFADAAWLGMLDNNISCVSIGSRSSRFNPLLYYRVLSAVRRINPDILHAHAAKAAFIFQKLRYFLSMPWLATKHNSRKGEVFNNIKNITAVSGSVAATIRHPAKIIYNGIAVKDLSLAKDNAENASLVGSGTFRVLAVGRLDRIKAFDLLISAMTDLPEEVRLKIVGEGPEHNALKAQIEKLHLQNRVRLSGYSDNVPGLMADAQLVLIASHSEGFSLVLVESLFYANVLLSTKVGGAEEFLPPALLMDQASMAEHINAVKQDYPRFRAMFSECKSRYAQQLTDTAMAEQYEQFYLHILKQDAGKTVGV